MNPHTPAQTILAFYFGQRPASPAVRDALREVGMHRQASDFSVRAAAAGTVLLGTTRRGFEQTRLDRRGLAVGTRAVTRWGSYQPTHLFTVDWSDGHLGTSSSECAYFVVPVPEFGRRVVVASAPTTESFGYFDVALGHAALDEPLTDGVLMVLSAHWRQLRERDMDPPQRVIREGLINEASARQCAREVWDGEANR